MLLEGVDLSTKVASYFKVSFVLSQAVLSIRTRIGSGFNEFVDPDSVSGLRYRGQEKEANEDKMPSFYKLSNLSKIVSNYLF
jgi:hypothetical protein